MEALEAQILSGSFTFVKERWWASSLVDQRRRQLQLVADKVLAAVEATGSLDGPAVSAWRNRIRVEARRGLDILNSPVVCDDATVEGFASRIRAMVVGSPKTAELERITDAIRDLERLSAPGGDIETLFKLMSLHDGDSSDSARCRRFNSVAARSGLGLPAPGGKRKLRADLDGEASDGARDHQDDEGSSTGHTNMKRLDGDASDEGGERRLQLRRQHGAAAQAPPRARVEAAAPAVCSCRLRRAFLRNPPPVSRSRRRARALPVAMALSKIRRRMGSSTGAKRRDEHVNGPLGLLVTGRRRRPAPRRAQFFPRIV
nr:unnamed protein product [Digitaria exilis]